ncbi:MAG: helix-turn-helix domain-containing protein [Clostridiales bacterium]|nr:helix-turn-helix domain-containing protein [Clostridiales bacterium]
MAKFNEVLKFLRTSRNVTQSELAKVIGVSPSTIGMYESGDREPNFEIEEKIADYFNVSLDLLRGKTGMDPKPQVDITVVKDVSGSMINQVIEVRPDYWRTFDSLTDENKQQAISYINYLKAMQKDKGDQDEHS